MVTLGVHDGHTATACIMRDGKVLACISEERLNRVKEWGGFPEKAILECLRITKIHPSEIKGAGVVGLMEPTFPQTYNQPHFIKKLFGMGTYVLPQSFLQSNGWVKLAKGIGTLFRNKGEIKAKLKQLGITAEPTYYEHHFLHALTAHFCSGFNGKKNLVITCDGSGDAVCASVNIGEGDGIERIAEISTYNSIGEFYTKITQYLGMKPMSHEYKVMGLAPYAKEEHSKKTLDLLEQFFQINKDSPLIFRNTSGYWKWQYIDVFREKLFGHRFDNIARAAQTLVEKILIAWIQNCIQRTSIKTLSLSGGVL